MAMFDILMVCTGNICRSPMAAGLLKYMLPADLKQRVAVSSAGTHALHGHQPEPYAVEAIARWGIDIRAHRARQVSHAMIAKVGLTLAMERAHVQFLRGIRLWKRGRIKLLSEFDARFGPQDAPDIADPYGGPPAAYEECLRVLRPCIEGLVDWLIANENVATTDHRNT